MVLKFGRITACNVLGTMLFFNMENSYCIEGQIRLNFSKIFLLFTKTDIPQLSSIIKDNERVNQ